MALASALGLLAVACGSSSADITVPTPGPGGEPVIRVEMRDNRFSPANLTVRTGKKYILELRNKGKLAHNLRIAGPDNVYDSGDDLVSELIAAGATGSLAFTFDKPGVYNIRCDPHAVDMVGALTVWEPPPIVEIGSPTPTPTAEGEQGEEGPTQPPAEAPAETATETPTGP
ncbi:MAG: cupredoxin domain-containing protein [Chloroflexota bacterium]|nr:cupredoxin domain-containing protein [Chloroflexota bacterium]